ncbi:activator of photopigment and puc expression [Candidatus Vecturithrix granuli]|uniref:Activator of photopigment and puc expression n=1 Tax=Vecturithrix granuli TaxID=1499967 RepID=A0A081C1D8_VECG1|nr:activator of photopigment and puc expression [Candidatus Vecturithrix granuli]
MNLYRLIYMSDAADYIDWEDLKDILTKSEKNNAKIDVTGMLVFSDNKFLQVLEGPAKNLSSLYAKISQDARHRNCLLISYTPIHQRVFSAWAMKGVNLAFMKPEMKQFLVKKYGASGTGIALPKDEFLAFSVLYDVYHLNQA